MRGSTVVLTDLLLFQVRYLQGQVHVLLVMYYLIPPAPRVLFALLAWAGSEGPQGCELSDPSTCFRCDICRGSPEGAVYSLNPPPVSGSLPAESARKVLCTL
jgi:hypothetical protein